MKHRGRFWREVHAFEDTLVRAALKQTHGNISAAARALGLGRTTFARKVRAMRRRGR